MKKIMLFVMTILSLVSFSQKNESTVMVKGNVIEWEINKDPNYGIYFIYTFKNEKYDYINDYNSIVFTTYNELNLWANNLISISKETSGVEYGKYATDNFMIIPDGYPDKIYVCNRDDAWFKLSKEQAISLGNEVKKYSYLLK